MSLGKGLWWFGLGLTVDPVEVVKFYLGKLLECSGRDDILFSAMRAQVIKIVSI